LLIVLSIRDACRSEKQRKKCHTDYTCMFHLGSLLSSVLECLDARSFCLFRQ
jgi:hypothetical protein